MGRSKAGQGAGRERCRKERACMPGVRRGQEGRCRRLRSWKGPSCAGSGGGCPLRSGPLLCPTLAGAVPKPERANTEESMRAMGQRQAGKGMWRGRGRVRMQRAGLRSSLPRALGSQRSGASGPPRTGQRVPKAPQWEQQLCPSSILTVSGPLVRPPGKLQSGRGGTARAQCTQLQGLTDTGQQHSQEVNFDSGFQTRGF